MEEEEQNQDEFRHKKMQKSKQDLQKAVQNTFQRQIQDKSAFLDQQKEIMSMKLMKKEEGLKLNSTVAHNLAQLMKSPKEYAQVSLCCLGQNSRFRMCIVAIVESTFFEGLVLLTIVANSVTLAMEDPLVPEDEKASFWQILEYVYLAIYTVEMVFKVIAMGFVMSPCTYLRDSWNVLDFLVVLVSLITINMEATAISFMRIFRILRPLKTLHALPSLAELVKALIALIPKMLDILALFAFTMLVFGTIGLQLFMGALDGRCVQNDTIVELNLNQHPKMSDYLDAGELWLEDDQTGGFMICKNDVLNLQSSCPERFSCIRRTNPGQGITSFDNILSSMLAVFEAVSLEGWTDTMYTIRHAHGNSVAFDAFFFLVVVFGTFFVLNLMTAVQFNYFEHLSNQEKKRKQSKIERGNTFTQEKQSQSNSSCCKSKKKTDKKEKSIKKQNCCCVVLVSFQQKVNKIATSQSFEIAIMVVILINSVILGTEHYDQPQWLDDLHDKTNIGFTIIFSLEMLINLIGLGCKAYVSDAMYLFDGLIVIISWVELLLLNGSSSGISVLRCFRIVRIFKLMRSWDDLRLIMKTISKAAPEAANLGVLTGLFVFINALIGKQFFYGVLVDEEGEPVRYSFSSFGHACLTVFIVMSGENWNEIMKCVCNSFGPFASIYFVQILLVGNFMLLNLFLAILLKYTEGMGCTDEDGDSISLNNMKASHNKESESSMDGSKVKGNDASELSEIGEENTSHSDDLNNFHQMLQQNYNQDNIQTDFDVGQQNKKSSMKKARQIRIDDKQQELKKNLPKALKSKKINSDSPVKIQAVQAMSMDDIDVGDTFKTSKQQAVKIQAIQAASIDDMEDNNLSFCEHTNQSRGDNQPNQKALKLAEHMITHNAQTHPKHSGSESKVQVTLPYIDKQKQIIIDTLHEEQRRSEKYIQRTLTKNRILKSRVKKFTKVALDGPSLCVFQTNSCFRLACKRLVEWQYFENFIYALIALNAVILLNDTPNLSDQYLKRTLTMINDIITFLFVFETVIKIIAMGFVRGKHAYAKDPFNVFDFIIVLLSMVTFAIQTAYSEDQASNFGWISAFRSFRSLRPLRMVSKNQGMKLVVNSLLASIPRLMNVILVTLMFFYIFAILGVQLLSGRVSFCELGDEAMQEMGKETCLEQGGTWVLPNNNYNNIFNSFLTFFEVSTLEMWPDIMYAAIDSQQEPNLGPLEWNRFFMSILYVIFILITSFFVLNLFISVIIEKFQEEAQNNLGMDKLSDSQKEWLRVNRFMLEAQIERHPKPSKNKCRKCVYDIVQSNWFDNLITGLILLNMVFLCIEFQDAGDTFLHILTITNNIFVVIFTFESGLKLIGQGPFFYFSQVGNNFDFFIVVCSLLSLKEDLLSINITALRLIRVMRLLRLLNASQSIQNLIKTLYGALLNILNVCVLYFLIIFVFTLTGMNLFGDIDQGKDGFINLDCNFQSFYVGMMVLIRASTGESWNGIMYDTCPQEGSCFASILYWTVFMLISFFIFINVLVAVIFEEFVQVSAAEEITDKVQIKIEDIQNFCKTWEKFDKYGTLEIDCQDLPQFLETLPTPIGYAQTGIDRAEVLKMIQALNILCRNGKLYFPEVMWPVFHAVLGVSGKGLDDHLGFKGMLKKIKMKYPLITVGVGMDMLCGNLSYNKELTASEWLAGKFVLKHFRQYVTKKYGNEKKPVVQIAKQDTVKSDKETEFEQLKRQRQSWLPPNFSTISKQLSSDLKKSMQIKKAKSDIRGQSQPKVRFQIGVDQDYVASSSSDDSELNTERKMMSDPQNTARDD